MSRSRHVGLEDAETTTVLGRGRREQRRAVLEQEIAAALADADREMVSRLREELALLDVEAEGDRGRRADW